MKYYWDTSAALNCLVSEVVRRRLESGDHYTRRHTFSELFSTITGRGIPQAGGRFTLTASDAAIWIRELSDLIQVVDLDLSETLDGFDQASSAGVQGARIYDFEHALAASKAGAEVLLTRDKNDFTGLTAARIEQP